LLQKASNNKNRVNPTIGYKKVGSVLVIWTHENHFRFALQPGRDSLLCSAGRDAWPQTGKDACRYDYGPLKSLKNPRKYA